MSTHTNNSSAGEDFLKEARDITLRHLEMVNDECLSLFTQKLTGHWTAEGILDEKAAAEIPARLARTLKLRYAADQCQQLCAFYLDFFSGGLSEAADGALSFTSLQFEGLVLFEKEFGARLPQADRKKLQHLISLLQRT